MRIYKYIHSCLLVEEGDDKILFDPGTFSFVEGKVSPATFKDISTVVITHPHPDHVEIAQFARTMATQIVIPVHDGYVKDFFLKLRYDAFESYFSSLNITLQRMYNPGDVVEL